MDVLNGRSNPLVMRLSTSLVTLLATLAPAWLCAQQLTVTLVAPEFNGHHVDCFGHRTGSIDATVSGGTPPYQYKWSNGTTTEDLAQLRAGYYKLTVMDADSVQATAEITLTEPGALAVVADPYVYPNKHNVSCHDCYNGSITVEVDGGVAPYTHLWSDSATTKDRSGLGAMTLQLTVTDANGCAARSDRMQLTQPGRESWDMTGNTGTDPNAHYIGTADTADMVFRTHGVERMRLLGDGGIKLPSAGTDDVGFIMKGGDGGLYTGYATKPWCFPEDSASFTPWYLCGNEVATNGVHFLGTVNEQPLNFRTNGQHRMVITAAGKVGIGTQPSAGPPDGYRLYVQDGIVARDVLITLGAWPDYVFDDGYRLMPLSELRAFLKRNRHLPGIPSAMELETEGGVELGEMQRNLVRTVEEQTLYILQLEERLQRMEQRLQALGTSGR